MGGMKKYVRYVIFNDDIHGARTYFRSPDIGGPTFDPQYAWMENRVSPRLKQTLRDAYDSYPDKRWNYGEMFIKTYWKETNRIDNLVREQIKIAALAKLTDEEIEVLGLPTRKRN